jgi:hypothetical protein
VAGEGRRCRSHARSHAGRCRAQLS